MSDAPTINAVPRRFRRIRRVLFVSGSILVSTMTFAGLLAAGATVSGRELNGEVPDSHGRDVPRVRVTADQASTRHDRRLVVAFVAGEAGSVASDLLAPYDVFASSPAFVTYVVAAHSAHVPLEGGPALVPMHTFAEVDAEPALKPDLVVVPALSKPTDDTEAALRSWVTAQHRQGARVLGVCAGSVVLARTGILDGLHATSHWSRIGALRRTRPAVHWVTGRRWVEDGSVTTTAAVTSGVPAALHLVAELAGDAEAVRIANTHPELGWRPHQTTVISKSRFAVGDWPVALNFTEPWFRPSVGIALRDGVDELDATAAFEVYAQSGAAHTVALSKTGTVRTRHGLLLLTRTTQDAPSLSRVLKPRGGGFTSALQDLREHTDASTASSTAKMIGYPTLDDKPGIGQQPVRTVLLAVATVGLAILVGLVPSAIIGRRRRRA